MSKLLRKKKGVCGGFFEETAGWIRKYIGLKVSILILHPIPINSVLKALDLQ